MKLGEHFVHNKIVNEEEIQQALQLQEATGGRLGDIILAMTSMRALDYYKALAEHYQIEFIDLLSSPTNQNLFVDSDKDMYFRKELIPIRKKAGIVTVATCNPSPAQFEFIKRYWGKDTQIVCTSRFDVLSILQRHYKNDYLSHAIDKLVTTNIELSSKFTMCTWQRLFLLFVFVWCIYYASVKPINFLVNLNIFLMIGVAGIILYKIILSAVTFTINFRTKKTKKELLQQDNLPIYSIFVPLFQEKEVTLRHLFFNLSKIDYPKHKLDIKILLEQDDLETIAILKELKVPSYFEFLYIPLGIPRTKAKACNYGLQFARGEYLTLYDAEDKPDPLQLRIALDTFTKYKDENLAVVQSRLNFYNSYDNWLTTMFAIEYTYWFDLLLPALEFLNTPIPLGGTSNHFKTQILRDINAWDPYNVAEDADIGIRIHRLGYTSRVIDSTTYEEANCKLGNWIKQRTRWIKGYMQTYLVHMHNPYKLWRSLGTSGFIGFHLFIGGTILTNLCNIVLWFVFFLSLIVSSSTVSYLFPANILYLAQINFIAGSLCVIILNTLGVLRRKKYKMLLFTLTSPIYWLFMSIASYRAIYQLVFKPSHWEKTEHGISKILN